MQRFDRKLVLEDGSEWYGYGFGGKKRAVLLFLDWDGDLAAADAVERETMGDYVYLSDNQILAPLTY